MSDSYGPEARIADLEGRNANQVRLLERMQARLNRRRVGSFVMGLIVGWTLAGLFALWAFKGVVVLTP